MCGTGLCVCGVPEPNDTEIVGPLAASSTVASLAAEPASAPGTTEISSLISSSGGWGTNTVTYGFANGAQDYPSVLYSGYNEPSKFLHFSETGKDILRDAFSQWDAVSGLTLTEISDAENAVIRVGGSEVPDTAWAYSPGTYDANGDIWFGLDKSFFSKMVATTSVPYLGSYEYLVSMHEIGHTLGLKHPHEGSPILASGYDGLEYTVMSYRSYLGGPTSSYTVESWGYPQSLMMLDLAAIQQLHGANYAELAGNTTYTFDPTTGEMFIDGAGQGTPGANRVFRTLWDGNGTDLIDLSNYTTDLAIDLNAGAGIDLDVGGFSQRAMLNTGQQIFANKHIYMSLLHQGDTRSLIENATGGSGDDSLTGNQVGNVLTGGAGDDILTGGLGADTLVLGVGMDTVRDSLAGLNGDTVSDFDASQDRILVTGVTLTAAQVSLDASGVLTLNDGSGAVTLNLGAANGGKTLVVSADSAGTVITTSDYTGGGSGGGGGGSPVVTVDDPVVQNGSSGNDTFTGGTGDDQFLIRYGDDTATGNEGADTFIIDWRYVNTSGDEHTITDLDFSQGDVLEVRLFDGPGTGKVRIASQADLDGFLAKAGVSATALGSGSLLTLDNGGKQMTLSLNAGNTGGSGGGGDEGPVVVVDDPVIQNGSARNDTFTGGTGDDKFLLRYGDDTATGNAGADAFLIDWRYVNTNGDDHTITDLDFAEGDYLDIRMFNGTNRNIIDSQAELDAFIASSAVSAAASGSGQVLTLSDGGKQMTLALNLGATAGDLVDSGSSVDDPILQNGSGANDTFTGGTGDDQFLLRYGDDTATGNEGADAFLFDWRYKGGSDSHTVTDLNFAEGDYLDIRMFNGANRTVIDTQADLDAFALNSSVTMTDTGSGLQLTLTEGSETMDIYLAGL